MTTTDQLKAATKAIHARVRATAVAPAPSEPMERWIRYNWALAKYSEGFHGGLTMAYNQGPTAFAAMIGALENAFQSASGPSTRTPTFRGLRP